MPMGTGNCRIRQENSSGNSEGTEKCRSQEPEAGGTNDPSNQFYRGNRKNRGNRLNRGNREFRMRVTPTRGMAPHYRTAMVTGFEFIPATARPSGTATPGGAFGGTSTLTW